MKRFSSLFGALGLLTLLSAPFTLLITGTEVDPFSVPFIVKVVLGLVLLGLWFGTKSAKIADWTRSVFFVSSSAALGLLFAALLVGANFIVSRRNKTWDLTHKKLFSLSLQTTETLKALTDPLRVLVFSTQPLPDQIDDLFRRYREVNDRLSWEVKDPRKTPDLVAKYKIRDQQFAAVLLRNPGTPNERSTTANLGRLADPREGEEELTNALIRLEKSAQQRVYFIEGHGEIPLDADPSPSPMQTALPTLAKVRTAFLNDGYVVDPLNLGNTNAIPQDAAVLVVAGAKTSFTEGEKVLLERYLEEGGRLLFFADAGLESGLDALLAKYGLQIDNGVVADPRVDPEQPYFVVAPFFGDHETVSALKAARMNALFFSTRAFTILREGTLPGVTALPTVLSTPQAWLETHPDETPKLDPGEKAGQLALVAVSSRDSTAPSKRFEQTRVVLFGDTQVLLDLFSLEPDRNLVLNAMAWLSNQPKKLTIRPPDSDLSSLQINAATIGNIQLVVMDVVPLVLLGLGVAIWLARKAR
jgi:hypothetical protein